MKMMLFFAQDAAVGGDHVGGDHVGGDHVGADHVGADHVGADHPYDVVCLKQLL